MGTPFRHNTVLSHGIEKPGRRKTMKIEWNTNILNSGKIKVLVGYRVDRISKKKNKNIRKKYVIIGINYT